MDHDPLGTGERVVLYTIPGQCPLCDTARNVLAASGVAFREVDIRTDRTLLRAYRNEIPVVTVDGAKRFIGRVSAEELSIILASGPQSSESDS